MGKENFSKVKLLKIWEILSQDSDENNPLSTNELLERLAENGIICDRRTLYSDIEALNFFGYEVMCVRGQHSNKYYVADRSFDVPELCILIDAVQAASFITPKKTKELVYKVAALGGSHKAEILRKNIVQFNTTKHRNENIYYIIDTIEESIIQGKKIAFAYFDYNVNGERVFRRDGKRYVANPIATVFSNDNYYLVCVHDNHKTITSYRIDRMERVSLCTWEVDETLIDSLDVLGYKKQAFFMYGGEVKQVTFEASAKLIDVIMDKFGEDVNMKDLGEGKIQFTANVQVSPTFLGWCCSFGGDLKVMHPSSVVSQLKEHIEKVSSLYE